MLMRKIPLVSLVLMTLVMGCSSAKKEGESSDSLPAGPSIEEAAPRKKAVQDDPYALITCASRMETRTLAIASKEEGGCELRYEKNERTTTIPAYSAHSVTHCVNAREKIKKTLTDAGWKCVQ